MVSDQFRAALDKQGVQPIDTKGQNFDPHLHEAVGEEVSELPKGAIVREETKGYRIHGRLLRASRVVVSKGNEKEV
jgi:molecular chaperone GrpE